MPTTKARILAVCAAAVLTAPALGACSTYHDTSHDRCDPNATANAFTDPGDGAVTYDNAPDCGTSGR